MPGVVGSTGDSQLFKVTIYSTCRRAFAHLVNRRYTAAEHPLVHIIVIRPHNRWRHIEFKRLASFIPLDIPRICDIYISFNWSYSGGNIIDSHSVDCSSSYSLDMIC